MNSHAQFLANGRLHPSTGERSVKAINPATEEPSATIRLCSPTDLDLAIQSAQTQAQAWSTSSLRDRQDALRKLSSSLQHRTDDIVRAMADDIGCPVWLSRALHVPMAIKDFDNAIEFVGQVTWRETVGNAVVERVPVGVIGAITPWNAPMHQMAAKVGAAIAAGCTVVLKPSELAPACAQIFMEAVEAAGLPPGLVNVVWGDAELGAALVADGRIDQISFTGSTTVGRQIMAVAAQRFARVTMELGGKSAAVVLDDADLDAALAGVVRSCMANSGQTCVAQTRLIAPKKLLGEIERRLVEIAKQWPVGSPYDEATRLGPIASAAQFAKVQRMIAGAKDAGARLLCGGEAPAMQPGYYIAPTIFSDVLPSMEIAHREVFGPVLSVLSAEDDEDAVRLANATPYGLSGAVWSGDVDRAAHVSRRMRTGQVVVNGAAQNLATPFGGWGHSGFGRENGRFGIEECLQYRSLHGLADAGPAAGASSGTRR